MAKDTPIKLYYSATAAAVPLAADLSPGELAINTNDGKLFYKDSSGVVQTLASKASAATSFSAGTTGFTPSTATTGAVTLAGTLGTSNGGTNTSTAPTNGGVVYGTATAMAYSAAGTSGQVLISAGAAAPTWSAFTGTGSVVKDTSPTLVTPVLGTPTSGNLANCTFPTLNQNTTGTAAGLSATLVIGSGGTNGTASPTAGAVSYGTGSAYAFSAAGTSGRVLISGGTGSPTWAAVTGTGSVVKATSPTIDAATLTGANTIQGMVVGRGVGASGVAFGAGVLASNTSGTQNTAVGDYALIANTTGSSNTVLGYSALTSNTTGLNSIAIGPYTLAANNGDNNVAIGSPAMNSNTSGFNNTAVGYAALNGNTTGNYNTAVGASSGGGGSYNVAVGYTSGGTSGSYNVGIGNGVNYLGSSGSYNTAVGNLALYSLTSGAGNTAISPTTNTGSYSPVFDPTTQSNRFCMGSTTVTNAYIQVAWTVVSDARDKTDFAAVPHGLDFVSKLEPVAYRYKETRDATRGHGPLRYGFKAQDVLSLEGDTPVIVDNEDANKLRFNDQALLAVIVNAIKELKAEFDEYKATHP